MPEEPTPLLLSAQPEEYLKDGFFAAPGQIRPELLGLSAFAVAQSLLAGETSLDELSATLAALREVLPELEGTPAERYADGISEALEIVRNMANIENNLGLEGWLMACEPFIRTEADLGAFLEHFQTVLAQYGALLAVHSADETGGNEAK